MSRAYPRSDRLPAQQVWLARVLLAVAAAWIALLVAAAPAKADTSTWNGVVDEMAAVLDHADQAYRAGDPEGAKAAVNDAYYGYYEKLGFEATVMSHISGDRATEVEYRFAGVLKDIKAAAPADQVAADLATLVTLLREDANVLDGAERENPWATFAQALLIILREGVEAILVVGAIIAYLVKSGNADKTRVVYFGAGFALLASLALAWLLNTLTGLAGANQEIIEGITILIAVAMLIYVSNWILSRSGEQAFERYLERKSQESIASGSLLTLAFVAFLAVFREGAEVILFLQVLIARTPEDTSQVWLGLGVGAVALIAIYLAVRILSIRIPLRPFFLATSALLAVMAFSFAGSGIKELQEGGVVSVTTLPGAPTVDLLGIYPTVETLATQAAVGVLLVLLAVLGFRKGRLGARARAAADPTREPATQAAQAPAVDPARPADQVSSSSVSDPAKSTNDDKETHP